MTHVKTSIGFEADIDEANLNDLNFLEILGELEEGKAYKMPKLALLMLGEENKKAFYKAMEDEKGRVPVSVAEQQLTEIMQQLKPIKN